MNTSSLNGLSGKMRNPLGYTSTLVICFFFSSKTYQSWQLAYLLITSVNNPVVVVSLMKLLVFAQIQCSNSDQIFM